MKALLIAETEAPVRKITEYIAPYGFDIIHYRFALKAIDNIEEIMPDAVFISAGDFPRHWKTIVQYIRADTDKDTTIIALLINERFTAEDADKAVHIGVQAIISETLSASNDEHQLFQVFSRYRPVGDDGRPGAYIADRAVFLFTNPLNDTIITGKLEGISWNEIKFKPDAPSMVAELAPGEILEQCSLKIGGKIISPKCRIRKNAYLMILEMVELNAADRARIDAFIAETE